ncbi:hypothetical protein K474DRAFT_1583992, partial [Panus rudis PR-1116 ss-1]
MNMLLSKGEPTLRASASGRLTRPDNVFGTDSLRDSLVMCEVHPELQPTFADHFPIHVELSLDLPLSRSMVLRAWRDTEWVRFAEELENHLAPVGDCTPIATVADFKRELATLMDALDNARERAVPFSEVTAFTKRWYTKEVKERREEVTKLGRKAYDFRAYPNHHIHREYRRLRNRYGALIRRTKRRVWETFIGDAAPEDIWGVSKYVRADPSD